MIAGKSPRLKPTSRSSHRISTRHTARKGSLWRDFSVVLGRPKLWGIYFGHFAWGTTSTFFLTWFPTYLVTYMHLDFIKAGFYASCLRFDVICGPC